VLFDKAGNPMIQLASFFDLGGAWNVGGSENPSTLYSIGAGILLTPDKHITGQLYWGYRLNHVYMPYNNAQDLGLTFRVNIAAF